MVEPQNAKRFLYPSFTIMLDELSMSLQLLRDIFLRKIAQGTSQNPSGTFPDPSAPPFFPSRARFWKIPGWIFQR